MLAKSVRVRRRRDFAAKQDRSEETCAMLAEIYGWFTEGLDTGDLKNAKALRDELSG